VLPAYRRAFLIQKSAGGGLSYKVKNIACTVHFSWSCSDDIFRKLILFHLHFPELSVDHPINLLIH